MLVHSRFGTELFVDPLGDFKDLRQVSSVQDYVDTFNELLTRVELTDECVVSCFIRELKIEIGLLWRCLLLGPYRGILAFTRIQEQTLALQQPPHHLQTK